MNEQATRARITTRAEHEFVDEEDEIAPEVEIVTISHDEGEDE
jgi:hypothetical protein